LTKAFDCVSEDILLSKLAKYSISDKMIIWLKSYLENRKQMVELFNNGSGKCCSIWGTVEYGVPQGLILGPSLFLIYIHDFPSALNTNNKILLYVDDTSVLVSATNINEIQVKTKIILNSLGLWLKCNGLSVNLKINLKCCNLI
jgi:hypothetical protein